MKWSRRFATAACLLLAGCAQVDAPSKPPWPAAVVDKPLAQNLTQACVAPGTSETELFPERTSFQHSIQLQVSYHGHYKLLRFQPSLNNGDVLHFALVQCGAQRPAGLPPGARIVEVPVRRLTTSNASIYGAIGDLDAAEALVGVPNFKVVTVPAIQKRIAEGKVIEMYGWGHSSIEPAMAVNPDVYLTFYSAYPKAHMHPTLWRMGVEAVPLADHLESTPLGRAEWIKLLGLLLNREADAERIFGDIEAKYRQLQTRVADVRERPVVITGYASDRDTWDTQGGRNFRTQLIHDAGGRFAMEDSLPTTNGWLMLPFERVYAAGADAPVWLGGLQGVSTYKQLVEGNAHYAWLRPVRERNTHAIDKGYKGFFAYPYVDQGMVRPHWLLEDTIRVLHPDRLPPGEFHFVRSLKPEDAGRDPHRGRPSLGDSHTVRSPK